jgi:hypothetical protein
MMHRVKPVLQALVLADRVYQDVTGKKIIAGTFSGYKFSRRPPVAEITLPDGSKKRALFGGMSIGAPCAYVSLTDVCDGTKIQIQFINLTKNEVLFGNELSISNIQRLQNVELVLPLPILPIKEAGVYAIEIIWNQEVLGSWRIVAEDLDTQKKEQDHDNGTNST